MPTDHEQTFAVPNWGHIWTFAGLRPEGVPFGTPCDCGLTTWGAK